MYDMPCAVTAFHSQADVSRVDHDWKNAFFIKCLTPMLEAVVAVQQPAYAHIVYLDKSVRDFGVPPILDEHKTHDVNPRFLIMQRGLVTMSREIGGFFAGLSSQPRGCLMLTALVTECM